jgi:predicted permease
MSNLISAWAVIIPLILILVIGVIFRYKQIISPQGIKDIRTIIINICLPAIIFSAFYKAEYDANLAIITIVVFSVNLALLLLGFVANKLLRINKVIMPFLMSGFETGMIGYPLFALLFGSANLGYYAAMDFGHSIFIFAICWTFLRIKNDPNTKVIKTLKSTVTMPPIIAMIAGIIFGVTGLGQIIDSSEAGAILTSAVSFLSAPAAALILIVIGYGIEISRSILKIAVKTILTRIVLLMTLGLLAYVLLNMLIPMNDLAKWAYIIFFIMPPAFGVTMIHQKEDEQKYMATTLSIYSLISFVVYLVLAFQVF